MFTHASVAWSDVATVATALFTAVTAWAAWRSVKQSQELFDAAKRADLAPLPLVSMGTGTTELSVANVGGGIAKGVLFIFVAGGRKGLGAVRDGFLRPGDRMLVHGAFPHDEGAQFIVMWRDFDDTGWAVGRNRKVRVGAGQDWETTGGEVWKMVYADDRRFREATPIRPDEMQIQIDRM